MSDSGNQERALDEGDFMRLLMQHEPALRAFARSLLPNWTLVDEVIQEASLTLWHKFEQLAAKMPEKADALRKQLMNYLEETGATIPLPK
tara:strand:+ start:1705 stop:1974 length:270 start_codon:yes stop_codon:yes gene_type:complete